MIIQFNLVPTKKKIIEFWVFDALEHLTFPLSIVFNSWNWWVVGNWHVALVTATFRTLLENLLAVSGSYLFQAPL